MQISISSNIKEFTRGLQYIHKEQIPYATSRTINDLTYKAQYEVKRQIPNIFDNKKVWWKNRDTGVLRSKSNKRKLEGSVYTGKNNYFAGIQEQGGIRTPAKKNKYIAVPFVDNVPRSRLKSGSVRKYLNQKNVFVNQSNKIVYKKSRHKKGEMSSVTPLYQFTKKTRLKPRFHFYDICNGVLNSNLEKDFYKNLRKAVSSSKLRRNSKKLKKLF